MTYSVSMNVYINGMCLSMFLHCGSSRYGFPVMFALLARELGVLYCEKCLAAMWPALSWTRQIGIPGENAAPFCLLSTVHAVSLMWWIDSEGGNADSLLSILLVGTLGWWNGYEGKTVDYLSLWSTLQVVSMARWLGCYGETVDCKCSRSAAWFPTWSWGTWDMGAGKEIRVSRF